MDAFLSNTTSPTNSSITLPTLSSTTLIMSSSTSSPTPSSTAVYSGISKGASIGIGVGLTVGVLLILGGMLWFFSFHKNYQDDDEEFEIGPNSVDYRRTGTNLTMPTAPVFQFPDNSAKSAPFPTPASSLKSGMIGMAMSDGDEDLQGSSYQEHTRSSIDYDAQKRREGFF